MTTDTHTDNHIEEHPLVKDLVGDPGTPPTIVRLTGYAGPGLTDDVVRLYLDEEVRTWVDIPRKAVRHSELRPADNSGSHGVSVLWVDSADAPELVWSTRIPIQAVARGEKGSTSSAEQTQSAGVADTDVRIIRQVP